MGNITKSEVLLKIEELGWSDIIDNRWRQKLIGDIYDNFPDISVNTLEDVLNTVIIK